MGTQVQMCIFVSIIPPSLPDEKEAVTASDDVEDSSTAEEGVKIMWLKTSHIDITIHR